MQIFRQAVGKADGIPGTEFIGIEHPVVEQVAVYRQLPDSRTDIEIIPSPPLSAG